MGLVYLIFKAKIRESFQQSLIFLCQELFLPKLKYDISDCINNSSSEIISDDTISNNSSVNTNDNLNSNNNTKETAKLININTASLEELSTLSGIGNSKAEAIIEYRNKTKFQKIEDIMNVSGIGEKAFEKIKDYITV